ncbi:MAG: exonuclease [Rhodospirillaceae bacterium]|nr:MAG: exonuclease [Rhodospirillaceae bacterium]
MTTIDIQQGSESWFAIRAGKITGTRFAKVMAGDSTTTYKDLITDLAGEIITGEIEDAYSNAIMEKGKELEPEARKAYEHEVGNVKETGICLLDDYEDWVAYSPDGLMKNGLLEIKCPLRKTHLNYISRNELPNEYKWQVQGGLMVTGAKYCDFMSYYPFMKSFILRIQPDLDMHVQLISEIDKTIKLVKDKIKTYNQYDYQ